MKRLNLQQGEDARSAISTVDELMLIAVADSPTVFTTRPEVEKRLRMLWEWGAQLRQSNNTLRRQFATSAADPSRVRRDSSPSDGGRAHVLAQCCAERSAYSPGVGMV